MGEHAITFDWLHQYKSLRTRGHWWLDLLRSYLDFSYVCTGSNDSIYDTSITEVVDIPCRNSPYYVAYTRTWIFEPSVYIEWLWDRVTSFYCRLLRRLAFSESHHFSWDIDPANTMAYCNYVWVKDLTEKSSLLSPKNSHANHATVKVGV
jgi:hypothetical protein